MLKKQFTNTSRILFRLHSTNFKLISNNVASNFLYILRMLWLRWIGVPLTVRNMFLPTWLYIVNNWDCHLFHTGFSLSLFQTNFLSKKEKFKKSNLLGTGAHAVHKFRNPICTVIYASVIILLSSVVMLWTNLEISYAQNHFWFHHLTGNIVTSSNCHTQIY